MDDFAATAKAILSSMRDIFMELNAKEYERAVALVASLEARVAGLAADLETLTVEQKLALFASLDTTTTDSASVLAILEEPTYLAHATIVMSAHKIEAIRGLMARLAAAQRRVEGVCRDLRERLFAAAPLAASVLDDQLASLADATPAAAPLALKWMTPAAAEAWFWSRASSGDAGIWALHDVPGEDAVFDTSGLFDPKLAAGSDAAGIDLAMIERMRIMRMVPKGAGAAAPDFCVWNGAQLAVVKDMSRRVARVAEARNRSRLTYDALMELSERSQKSAMQERDQHKGVQRDMVFKMPNPVNSMIVKSLPDLYRYSLAANYYFTRLRVRKSRAEAVRDLLDYKSFSGAEVPLCDLYEQAVAGRFEANESASDD